LCRDGGTLTPFGTEKQSPVIDPCQTCLSCGSTSQKRLTVCLIGSVVWILPNDHHSDLAKRRVGPGVYIASCPTFRFPSLSDAEMPLSLREGYILPMTLSLGPWTPSFQRNFFKSIKYGFLISSFNSLSLRMRGHVRWLFRSAAGNPFRGAIHAPALSHAFALQFEEFPILCWNGFYVLCQCERKRIQWLKLAGRASGDLRGAIPQLSLFHYRLGVVVSSGFGVLRSEHVQYAPLSLVRDRGSGCRRLRRLLGRAGCRVRCHGCVLDILDTLFLSHGWGREMRATRPS